MKRLAVLGLALVVLLLLLWRSMRDPAAEPEAKKQEEAQPQQLAVKPSLPKIEKKTTTPVVERQLDPKNGDEIPKLAPGEKWDPMSDEFFYKFTERVPKVLTANASTCYETLEGSLHRNAKLVLKFNVKIRDGKVTVQDVKVKESDDPKQKTNSLSNPALESCFIQQIARSGWKDDELPDYDWPDELVLRPERGMKGFMKSNREYVGAEAPKRDPKAHIAIKPPPPPPEEPKKD
jgi:hypothetical protein